MELNTHIARRFGADTFSGARPTSTPICQTATFEQESATEFGAYDYTRSGNPTRAELESQLAKLEGGERGFAFGSGMAAVAASLGCLSAGDHLVVGDDLYGGSVRYIERLLVPRGVTVAIVDTTNLDVVEQALVAASGCEKVFVYLETPTNPLLTVSDLVGIARLTRAAGAALLVDNTMLSPYLQNPLGLGADLVLHSATKHLGGHGDLTAGMVVTSDSQHGRLLGEHVGFVQNAEGSALGPFDAWLLLRGLKTLGVRLDRECESALIVAQALAEHPLVTKVHYPGLDSHPGAQLNAAQARGAGSLLSFETGDPELSRRLVEAVKLFTIAVSFGNVSSSISLPCYMSHASVPEDSPRTLPARDLVRVSVGLESPSDLVADLQRALAEVSDVCVYPEGVSSIRT